MPVQASGIVIAGVTALAIYGSYKLPEKAGNGGEEVRARRWVEAGLDERPSWVEARAKTAAQHCCLILRPAQPCCLTLRPCLLKMF